MSSANVVFSINLFLAHYYIPKKIITGRNIPSSAVKPTKQQDNLNNITKSSVTGSKKKDSERQISKIINF